LSSINGLALIISDGISKLAATAMSKSNVIDVPYNSSESGTNIWLYPDNDTDFQRFKFIMK
jgi:hypothetical protein